MKKLTKVFTLALAFACLSLCFAGCANQPILETIAVKNTFKTMYEINQTLDVSNDVLVLTYDDGKQEEIALDVSMISGFDTSSQGSRTMAITYQEKTCTVDYEVTAKLGQYYASKGETHFNNSEIEDQTFELTEQQVYEQYMSIVFEIKQDHTIDLYNSKMGENGPEGHIKYSSTWTLQNGTLTASFTIAGETVEFYLTVEDGVVVVNDSYHFNTYYCSLSSGAYTINVVEE